MEVVSEERHRGGETQPADEREGGRQRGDGPNHCAAPIYVEYHQNPTDEKNINYCHLLENLCTGRM